MSQRSSSAPPPAPAPAAPCVLGVDVSKLTLDVCLLLAREPRHHQVPNTAKGYQMLFAWLQQHGATPGVIALEATGSYSQGLAQAAHQAGFTVLVFNPRRVLEFARASGRRNKTDRADAEVIARFVLSQPEDLPTWQPLPPAQAQLRELLRRQADLEQTLAAEQHRLEVAEPIVRPSLQRAVRWLEAELGRLEKTVVAHLQRQAALAQDVERLQAIGGCGQKTARLLAAEIPRHFRNARAVAAWLGVVPKQCQSGSSVRKAARVGHDAPWLRAKLYFPALTASRYDPRCQALAARLRAAGKAPKSIILAVLHKLVRTAFALLKNASTYDPDHQLSPAPCSP
jgi:transposase